MTQLEASLHCPWYRSAEVRRTIARRVLPLFAALSLAWEIAQLPLYTIWTEARTSQIAYAVIHCTLGDIMIGGFALAAALTLTRAGPLPSWRVGTIAAISVGASLGFTIFSEWLNVSVLRTWGYSNLMPVIPVVKIGLSPLLQWIVIPAAVFFFVVRRSQRASQSSRSADSGEPSRRSGGQ